MAAMPVLPLAVFAPGDAFWLARSKPTGNFYLVGRYTGCGYAAEIVGGTTTEPGATLVANPTLGDVAINAIDWPLAWPDVVQ